MISNRLIDFGSNSQTPDLVSHRDLKIGVSEDIIISRNTDGSVRSRYLDGVWDFTPYSVYPVKFYFQSAGRHAFLSESTDPHLRVEVVGDIKRIIFLLMYAPELKSGVRTKLRKPKSMLSYVGMLKKMGSAAVGFGLNLKKISKDEGFYRYFVSSISSLRANEIAIVKALLIYLHQLKDSGYKDLPTLVSSNRLAEFMEYLDYRYARKDRELKENSQRTYLIPSRIYANYIVGCLTYIAENIGFVDSAHAFFSEVEKNPFFCVRDKVALNQKVVKYGIDRTVLNEYSLDRCILPRDAYRKYGLDKYEYLRDTGEVVCGDSSSPIRRSDIKRRLRRIQSCCRLVCHAFTGMRAHETHVLPIDAYQVETIGSSTKVPFLRSYTSKISQDNYSKPAYWVTGWEVKGATEIAGKIAEIAAMLFGSKKVEVLPMFPSLNAETSDAGNHVHYSIPLRADPNWMARDVNPIIKGIDIREEDVEELEKFDMFVDWRGRSDILLGKPWPVSSHQFRRSLAVYGAKSGLVSLTSISVQFKHLTDVMTALYAENSSFSVSIMGEDSDSQVSQKQFAEELTLHRRLFQALRFSDEVLDSDVRLVGGAGKIIQKYKDTGAMPTWLKDRDETLKRFSEGGQSYRETVLGGCTNPNPCDKAGLGGVSACPSCEHSIIEEGLGSKVNAYIESLELSLTFLDKETPAYQTMTADVERLKSRGDNVT